MKMMFGFVDCAQVGRPQTIPASANDVAAVVCPKRRRDIALCCVICRLPLRSWVIAVNPGLLLRVATLKDLRSSSPEGLTASMVSARVRPTERERYWTFVHRTGLPERVRRDAIRSRALSPPGAS